MKQIHYVVFQSRVHQRGVPPGSSHRLGPSNRTRVPSLDVIDIDEDTTVARGTRQHPQNWNAMNAQTLSIMRQMSNELAQLKMHVAVNQNQQIPQQQQSVSKLYFIPN